MPIPQPNLDMTFIHMVSGSVYLIGRPCLISTPDSIDSGTIEALHFGHLTPHTLLYLGTTQGCSEGESLVWQGTRRGGDIRKTYASMSLGSTSS